MTGRKRKTGIWTGFPTGFLIIFVAQVFAQNPGYNIRYLTAEEGLSHNEVTKVIQDLDGFIWIGTRGGLNRYDGYEFSIYNQVPGDSNSLVNPSIETLFVDAQGNIWIGSKSGGVSKYNPVTGTFSNMLSDYKHPNDILSDNRILSIFEDRKGNIWFGTWGNGVIIYNEKLQTVQRFLNHERVNTIIETSDHRIWLGTSESGLLEYIPETNRFITHLKNRTEVRQLIEDTLRNALWIVTNPLTKLDLKTNESESYEFGGYSVFIDERDKVWVGTWGNGLLVLDPETGLTDRILLAPARNQVTNKDYDVILDIFRDRDKNIWIGTNGGGVCVLTPKLRFSSVGFDPRPNKGLGNTRIMTIVEDKKGNLWLGTIGSGLFWSSDRINYYPIKYPDGVLESQFLIIKYLYEDNSGKIWAGTNFGFYFIEFYGNIPRLRRFEEEYGNQGFRNEQVISILETENFLWVGSLHNGLFLLDKNNNYRLYKHFSHTNTESNKLESERISYLFRDSKGNIWIGTYNGLHLYNPSDSSVLTAEKYFSINGELSGNIITCLDEDTEGNIWVGTPNGLNRLSLTGEKKYRIDLFTENQGLTSNFIKGISHDTSGNIWISTNTGITKFIVSNKRFVNYSESDGINGKYFTEASVFRNNSGELFFGGSAGVTCFKPETIAELPSAHQPVLTALRIYNQPVKTGQKFRSKVILKQSITQTREIVIPYRFNNFEINFSALDYKSDRQNLYAYKLENHDNEWNLIGKRRFVNFNNLKPGEYTLLVKSSNSHNVWNENPTHLNIKILPPFWRTWYALFTYILIILGIVSLIRWNAMKQVHLTRDLELEKLKYDQEQIINELKFRFFTNISHEFRTPLTLILAPLNEILHKTKQSENLPSDFTRKLEIISTSATKLMNLVNQLIDFRKAEAGSMKLHATQNNLEEFVAEVCHPFFELAELRGIRFAIDSLLTEKLVWFDLEKMEFILNNLLSNAFKAVPEKGEIDVSLHDTTDHFNITVSDNGPGIPEPEIGHIFDRFYQVEKNENYGTSGIGLSLSKTLAELHRGNIEATSIPGKSTKFTISLRKGDAHLEDQEKVFTNRIQPHRFQEPALRPAIPLKPQKAGKPEHTILIVEDNREMIDYLDSLIGEQYRTLKAIDGSEGYDMAIEHKPDLILSDVMMPKMDGFELCEKIKKHPGTSTIPVILLTAKSAGQFKLLGTRSGADDYISKPFSPDYLLEKINVLLKGRKELRRKFSTVVRLEPSEIEIQDYDKKLLENAIQIIEKNIANPSFSSESLSSQLNTSISTLYRKLKSLTGLSSADFIRSVRVKRAAMLLRDKRKTISEISWEVGFAEVKNFRNAFKKQFGQSPAEYRDSLKEE